jgi:hypothetical protein
MRSAEGRAVIALSTRERVLACHSRGDYGPPKMPRERGATYDPTCIHLQNRYMQQRQTLRSHL